MITASCGHILTKKEEMGKTIAVKDCDGICYLTVCNKCFLWYKEQGLVLETEEEENDWLNYKT
jgi:hypothetical protein